MFSEHMATTQFLATLREEELARKAARRAALGPLSSPATQRSLVSELLARLSRSTTPAASSEERCCDSLGDSGAAAGI